MVMDKDRKNGMVLKRPHASAIARMSSTIKSSFRVTLSQVSTVEMVNQLRTPMGSPLHLKSVPQAMPKLVLPAMPKPVPKLDGGPMVMVKAQRNGTVSKKQPASPTIRTSSTPKLPSKVTSSQMSMPTMKSPPPTPWAIPSSKKVSEKRLLSLLIFFIFRNPTSRQSDLAR